MYEKKIATEQKRSTRHHRQLSGRFGDVLERALQCYGEVSATSTITTANITKTDFLPMSPVILLSQPQLPAACASGIVDFTSMA